MCDINLCMHFPQVSTGWPLLGQAAVLWPLVTLGPAYILDGQEGAGLGQKVKKYDILSEYLVLKAT